MSDPTNINMGNAKKGKESTISNICCGTTARDIPSVNRYRNEAIAIEIPMGTFSNTSTMMMRKVIEITISYLRDSSSTRPEINVAPRYLQGRGPNGDSLNKKPNAENNYGHAKKYSHSPCNFVSDFPQSRRK